MFTRTAEKLKAGYETAVSMPVRQSMTLSIMALIVAIIAVFVAVKK